MASLKRNLKRVLSLESRRYHERRMPCEPKCPYCLAFGIFHLKHLIAELERIGISRPLLYFDDKGSYHVHIPEISRRELQALSCRLTRRIDWLKSSSIASDQLNTIEDFEGFQRALSLPERAIEPASRLAWMRAHVGDDSKVRKMLGMTRDWYYVLTNFVASASLTYPEQNPAVCISCEGTGIKVEDDEEFADIASIRLSPRIDLLQFPVSTTDLARRVRFVLSNDNLSDARIVVIGDDDFVSLALCEVANPREVLVIEVDPRIVSTIEDSARIRKLPITVIQFDIREANDPEKLQPLEALDSFNIFLTDPPFTRSGLTWFSYLGMKLVSGKGVGYIAVPTSRFEPWTYPLTHSLQRFVLSNGFAITDKINNFHTYEGEEGIHSGIMRIESISDSIGKVTEPGWSTRRFYRDDR